MKLSMCFPEGKKKALTLSYDDGVEQDIRLLEIMNRHGIKGTFNISTGLHAPEGKVYKPGTLCRRLTRQAVINLYKNSGHEVSVHGYSHPYLTHLPAAAVTQEIYLDRIHLEADFETDVRGMAYPFGDCSYSEEVAGPCAPAASCTPE
jgi:peptidoglycan/xylan/chitin deacetylase (PgdA/CDA1 family)